MLTSAQKIAWDGLKKQNNKTIERSPKKGASFAQF
jgi:hypothetical protein